ncbi:TPA: tyrosine-type recombinase/integrase [Photobacterium damselae]
MSQFRFLSLKSDCNRLLSVTSISYLYFQSLKFNFNMFQFSHARLSSFLFACIRFRFVPNIDEGMKMVAFTDAWLRARCGKPYDGKSEITYRDGLWIRISPKGRITWIYRFLLNGKPVKMKIGEYPLLKIKEAEVLKDKKASVLASGLDPRVKSLRVLQDEKITLTQLIYQWYDSYAQSNIKQHKVALNALDTNIIPALGEYPVDALKVRDYMNRLLEIKSKNINTVIRMMQRLKQILTYAVKFGYLDYNPLSVITAKDLGEVSHVHRIKQNHDDVGAH